MNRIIKLYPTWKDINKTTNETKEISILVLEQLENQEQKIVKANKNLNESKEILDKSKIIINNMSWIGWFIGFVPFKSFFSRLLSRNNKEEILFIDNKISDETYYNQKERYSFECIEYTNIPIYKDNNENNCEILKLENELTDLLWIGKKIGEHLDLHNKYLDKLNDKSEILFDKTKHYTKKTNDLL
jgi:hypothetical protein